MLHLLGDLRSCLAYVSCGKDCLIFIPFRLPKGSCFTFSLKCFSSDPIVPMWQSDPCTSVPPPSELRSTPTKTPVSPPCSFLLPCFTWFYIFFPTGQILLYTLSWCSACISVSEGVFLMYPWREMYSTPTDSSTILFSLLVWF